jgi:SAM-dependent methyltransferase
MDAAGTRAYYATISPFYDAELALRDDLPCWLTLMDAWRARRSVEYGCGSGRLAVPLARRCAQWEGRMAGLDLSPAMLQLARQHWRRHRGDAPASALLLYCGDMRRASLGPAGDLVLFADDPLTHLAGGADLAATFRRAGEHLRHGGHLVVDTSLLPPEARGRSQPLLVRQQYRVSSPSGSLLIEQERRIDAVRCQAAVTYRYQSFDAAGAATGASTEAGFTAHYLNLADLEALFRLAGCRMEERWSDFHFHALTNDSAMVLCTGTKR